MTAVKSGIGTIRYNYVLYYIDRLTKDEANIDFVQSDAVGVLKGVIEFLGENGVEIEGSFEFTLFRQKFDDWCAGAYVSVNILVPDNDCTEGIFNTDGIDLRPLVVDKNGIYKPGTFDGYNQVTINVPQVGATEEWVDDEIDLKLTGYATESYVGSVVSVAMDTIRGEIPSLEGYATTHWVETQGYLSSCNLDPYATKNWVTNLGYLSSCDLDPYATKNWVDNQDFTTLENVQWYLYNQEYVTTDYLMNNEYVTESWTESWVLSQNYAPKSWVSEYLVSNSYTTQSWVENFAYGELLETVYGWVDNYTLSADYILSTFPTYDWVSEQYFATESWVSSQISDVVRFTGSPLPIGTHNIVVDDYYGIYIGTSTSGIVIDQSDDGYGIAIYSDNTTTPIATTDDVDNIFTMRISGYATQSWVSSNFTTETWVQNQGYLTSVPSEYATQAWVSSQQFATETYVGTQISGIESWVLSQGYITSAALSGYATESWVSSQISSKINYTDIWTGSIDDWEDLTPEEQCSYLIALIIE